MSELLDKQVNVQKESLKKTSGVHASSRKPTKKCAMKMKERKKVDEEKIRLPRQKKILWKEGFIRPYQKTG